MFVGCQTGMNALQRLLEILGGFSVLIQVKLALANHLCDIVMVHKLIVAGFLQFAVGIVCLP